LTRPLPVVLVHGAWFGSWCWASVGAEMDSRGHRVVAVDLPGRPGNPAPPTSVTLDAFTNHTLSVVRTIDRPVILAGHSLGGTTITHVADAEPDRIAAVVFVTAFLLRNGQAAVDVMRRDQASMVTSARLLVTGRKASVVAPDMARQTLFHDCPDHLAAEAQSRLVAESVTIARAPVAWSESRFGSVPRAFVECSRDRIITPLAQLGMVSSVGCDAVATIDTGHSPFLAAPRQLARTIASTASAAIRTRGGG